MKKTICVFLVLAIMLTLSSCSVRKTQTADMNKYDNYLSRVKHAETYMPRIEQCGTYSSAHVTYHHDTIVLFDIYTVGLFLAYDENEYHAQKAAILSDYEFFTQQDEELYSDCDAVVNGYDIKLVKKDYPYRTYKTGLLIGMDDAAYKICYLFYYDFDLDGLDDLDKYVEQEFYMR